MAGHAANLFPPKGNLLQVRKSLQLARMGYDLLDRKRNILVRELMMLIDRAKSLNEQIEKTYNRAYFALQKANITLGICEEVAKSVPVEESLSIEFRSVMGEELPTVRLNTTEEPTFTYSIEGTNSQLDNAYICFHKVKLLTAQIAEIENSIYRLAHAIKKTQGRANALKNIIIPRFEASSRFITSALEEKEREDFSRLKVIKSTKEKQQLAREEEQQAQQPQQPN